jgi:cephalosporin hydroxylase
VDFINERARKAESNWNSDDFRQAAKVWHDTSRRFDYQYMFEWCGLPIIQDPQDVVYLHELLWEFAPDIIIETGIARGGSLMLSASILATQSFILGSHKVPACPPMVIGIDIDIRKHNRDAIENHPLFKLITLIEGSSTDPEVIAATTNLVPPGAKVAIILDSHHSHAHVLQELESYSPLVGRDGFILVMDTGIEFVDPLSFNTTREWGPGNSPYSAVIEFLKKPAGQSFTVDRTLEKRHVITAAPGGLLRRSL